MPTDIYARLRDLAASAEAKPSEMRPVLLRVTTDLFALHPQHTPEEIRLYEEMADRLIDSADEATLIHVARKLAGCADAPATLLKRIRARSVEAEREILRAGPQIEWRDLRHVAASGACDLAAAVAQRSDLDREAVRLLAARPEREIARALAANPLAPLGAESLRLLALRGRDDPALARALLDRCAPTLDCLPLYLAADAQERARLIALALEAGLAQSGLASAAASETLDDDAAARIEAAAIRQKRTTFALLLADLLRCDSLCARRIVEDESGDALALAFVAIGLPQPAAARIFLIAFPKVALSPDLFGRTMKLFQAIPRRVATRIVDAMTGAPRAAASSARAPVRPFAATVTHAQTGAHGSGASQPDLPLRKSF
ncbi:DUF2336 domain-containing protein [Rhodoblastus sp.]|uniref:DUF2336 domain-containing protein n=1 Tax=Rhodoblastus sp. TaxID=1962975 RepID=UPI0035AE7A05